MKDNNFYVGEFYKNISTNFIYELSSYFDEVYIFKSIVTGGTMDLGMDKIKKEFIQVNKDGTPVNKFAEANKYKQIEKMKNEENKLQKIQINSTVDAILVSPKMYGTMALVDLVTLKRITSYMKGDSFANIVEHFISGLKDCTTMEQYIGMMKEEILFHESVNLISTIELPEQEGIKEEIKTSIH